MSSPMCSVMLAFGSGALKGVALYKRVENNYCMHIESINTNN